MSRPRGRPDRPPKRRDDVPEGFDPIGVPRAGAGLDALMMVAALVAALVGLIVTVGYIVYYRLHT
jgi:hypothetical protein